MATVEKAEKIPSEIWINVYESGRKHIFTTEHLANSEAEMNAINNPLISCTHYKKVIGG